jgi:hypothetical protein
MPYIRVELDVRTDPRWAEAPDAIRAHAKALYLDAVSYSGELLTDGHVPASVMAGLAAELGIKRPARVVEFLLGTRQETAEFSSETRGERAQNPSGFSPVSAHLARTKTGYFVNEWSHFHDSRQQVQKRRSSAAERKRASRAQTSLPMSHPVSQRDTSPLSQRDTERDSRAHERTREVETEEDLTRAVDLDQPHARANGTPHVEDPEPSLTDKPEPALDEQPSDLTPLKIDPRYLQEHIP